MILGSVIQDDELPGYTFEVSHTHIILLLLMLEYYLITLRQLIKIGTPITS
jgi:hypothetical protein